MTDALPRLFTLTRYIDVLMPQSLSPLPSSALHARASSLCGPLDTYTRLLPTPSLEVSPLCVATTRTHGAPSLGEGEGDPAI
jgi:hypothetical protein